LRSLSLSEILSHFELIPDAALTVTLYKKEGNGTMRFNLDLKKISDYIKL